MLRSLDMIRLSSRKILISTCLLLVLTTVMMTQIAGQSTLAVTVCLDLEFERIYVLINDEPFCILLSDLPDGLNGDDSLQLTGEVYEGTCDDPGNLIGTFTGELTSESGSMGDEFTIVIDFTVTGTDGVLHSKSKFTGAIVGEDSVIALNIVESEYAYFESNGVRVNLNFIGLEPESGAITFEENEVSLICLPTFIFSAAVEAPVGGILIPIDKLAVLIPSLVLAGLIAAVLAVVAVKRRR
jgi:hypothetical protein